jgi:hypothetical protein
MFFLQGVGAGASSKARRKSSIAPMQLDSVLPPKSGRRGSFTYVEMDEEETVEETAGTTLEAQDPVGYLELSQANSNASLQT